MKEFFAITVGAITFFIALTGSLFIIDCGLNIHRAYSLQGVGFETKVVIGTCYAKVDNKWLSCNVAASNTTNVNVNVKEVK